VEELRFDRTFFDECVDGYAQMAIDEAMLDARSVNKLSDWLRVWRFCPSAVSIGYFQRVSRVVNLEELNRLGIQLVRRFTGGGAVYHDSEGEIVYTVVLEARGDLLDVAKSFEVLCRALVEALRELGVEDAEFKPLNDVVVKNRKISGSAQARRSKLVHAILQHGTLLVSTNLEVMEKVLKPPLEKLRGYGATRIRDAVIRLIDVLSNVPTHRVIDALEAGFERVLKRYIVRDRIPREVLDRARELEPRYRSKEWIFVRV